jgi:hypothetical protein
MLVRMPHFVIEKTMGVSVPGNTFDDAFVLFEVFFFTLVRVVLFRNGSIA